MLRMGKARIKIPNRDCHGRSKNVSLLSGGKQKTTSGCKRSFLLLDYLTQSNLQGSPPDQFHSFVRARPSLVTSSICPLGGITGHSSLSVLPPTAWGVPDLSLPQK